VIALLEAIADYNLLRWQIERLFIDPMVNRPTWPLRRWAGVEREAQGVGA
jgi:hypothetical protein